MSLFDLRQLHRNGQPLLKAKGKQFYIHVMADDMHAS